MTETASPPENTNPKSSSGWIKTGIFFSVLGIVILIIAYGYGYFELLRLNQQLSKMMSSNTQDENKKTISSLQGMVDNIQQSMQKSEGVSSEQQKVLAEWRAAQSGDLSKWHIVQAEYLVKMANYQLQFANNIPNAVQLLQQADKELQFTQDSSLLEVRKSIATDLANLQTIKPLDITSIYLQLNALHAVVDKLKLPIQPLKSDENSANATQDSTWKAGFHSALQALNKIVIIRKNDASALPLVMPDEKIFLYQNLHAQLDNAAWGLLHGNVTVYTTSLDRTVAWVQQYFVQDAEETKYLLQQLAELQKINVQPANTTLNNTLQLIDAYRARATQGVT